MSWLLLLKIGWGSFASSLVVGTLAAAAAGAARWRAGWCIPELFKHHLSRVFLGVVEVLAVIPEPGIECSGCALTVDSCSTGPCSTTPYVSVVSERTEN